MNQATKRCRKCILSARFPRVEFDDNGICNFCRKEILNTTDDAIIEKARKEVRELIAAAKGKAEYDAVMCFSGGKDSTYTLTRAVREYGLKVLALTVDNGFLSPVTLQNIQRTVDLLGVDLITARPSSQFLIPLFKASALEHIYNPQTLTRISSVCNSCISLINITALKIALEKEIPLILAGFTLGQIPTNSIYYKNNYKFLEDSRKPVLDKLRQHIGKEVDDYFLLSESLMKRTESYPYTVNLLCLEGISEEEILEEIRAMGWVSPKDVDGCSSNCRLNAFNNFIHRQKLGFNPYELELSHLIRKGKITRDEAMAKVQDQFDRKSLQGIMAQLGITENDIEML